MWATTLLLALREIRRNLMRSILTMMGVVIGVAAVVTMVTLGNGATASVSQQIASLGSNLIMVMPGQRMGGASSAVAPKFKVADADLIAGDITGVELVAPTTSSSVTAVYGPKNWKTSVTGTSKDYLTIGNWKLASGRVFSDVEERAGRAVCIIGDSVRRQLYGAADPVGTELRIANISCQVIALLRAKGQGSMGNDQDDLILAPLRMAQRRLSGSSDVEAIWLRAKNGASTSKIKGQIETLLRERRKIATADDDNFNVLDTRQIADTLSGTTRVLTLLLGAVAAVSLLVGGIGIMNIMLVSVTERTREIGIRLSIGALGRDVLTQFLVEAVTLSATGGLIGIVLAAIASVQLSRMMGLPYAFNVQINVLSFVFSSLIGVVFGYFPARRAANLNPIDALRHE